jgi:Flp pilus assembly protein TadD
MGRTRTKKKAHTKASNPPVQHSTPPSIQSLLEKSQSLIVQCDYELALRFIHRILEQDAKNAEAKEMLGVAFLETGEIEKAKLVSFSFYIETGRTKYIFL